jgi:hydrogenase expression/formation protein HypE
MGADLLSGVGRAVTAQRRETLRFRDAHVEMAHGAGGKATRQLVDGLIAPLLGLPREALVDAAIVHLGQEMVAFTGDSFVVRPLTFPGGSIGELAVNGTVNDLAVSGARPLGLLVTLIVEAGLATSVLEGEMRAIGAAAACAAVAVVGGDTKVVEHGKADGLYITTAGFGRVDPRFTLSSRLVQPGDRVILSGPVGDHGITILLARGDVDLDADLRSDTRSVWPMVDTLGDAAPAGIRWMRDPTRGGIATVLNELARETGFTIAIDEASLPVREEVRGACELLGLDPLHIANEGQFVAVVSPGEADRALDALHGISGGESAAIIGDVRIDSGGGVLAVSPYGSARVVDMLVGDPLPRIC